MVRLKILTVFLATLIMPAYTKADVDAWLRDDLEIPREITVMEAAKLAQEQGENKEFSKTKWGNVWSIFESNKYEGSDGFYDSRRCYWRITAQNKKIQKQLTLQEKGDYCDRSGLLGVEPVLLDKNILVMDLPSERGGIFYIFYLTQDNIEWIAQPYMSLDEDSLNIKKIGNIIYAETLTDKYQVHLNKQQKPIVKKQ